MNPFLRITEILVLVVLPLLIVYLRSSWSGKDIYVNVTVLPLLWYLFYAPIHESGHILGCIVVGADITDYRLFTHFWEGSFGFAYVDVQGGLGVNMHSFIILVMPYLLDLISIATGYYVLIHNKIKNPFLFGLVFLIFSVRPLYDLADNFIGYFYNHSDFVLASQIAGPLIIFAYVILSVLTAITLILLLMQKYKYYPKQLF
jgi:hypothetical protein